MAENIYNSANPPYLIEIRAAHLTLRQVTKINNTRNQDVGNNRKYLPGLSLLIQCILLKAQDCST